MKIRNNIYSLAALVMLVFLSGCTESESIYDIPNTDEILDDPDIIHIGGIDNADLEISFDGLSTRAAGDNTTVDAETVDWLLGPLFGGLDITYGAKGKETETQKVAILKLLKKNENGDNTKNNIKYSDYRGPNGEKIAEYSFKYLKDDGTEGDYAKWYDNGEHYFQGVFVPENLRFNGENETAVTVYDPTNGKAKNLKFDQSKDDKTDANANYTLLERYLGMPADAYIHATVGRVKLPFRHRLARVVAYVLIDPTMGNDVTINGYMKDTSGNPQKDANGNSVEDATTSDIRFCDVKVLAGVKETASGISGHSTLTPIWDQARKVVPHFIEERSSINSMGEIQDADNFIMFYNKELKTYIFPANDDAWTEAKENWETEYTKALGDGTTDEEKRSAANTADENSNYKRTLYGKVPCYDIIVRPTYKSEEMVMYDEENYATNKADIAAVSNIIDFEITLNNGLQYYKEFKFDLDANYQTIVYLRISRESIDYNSSGAEIWKEESHTDGYYGVNNENGNTLSFAGSSWQRAYRFSSKNPDVTDGHYYGQDDATDNDAVRDDDHMPWYPQYVAETKWVEMFAEAHEGGLHHGDYFILDDDITIDARLLPDNFVFTGHLDGQDHTITLTNGGQHWDKWNTATTSDIENESITIYTKKDRSSAFVMPSQLFTKVHHDAELYDESELTVVNGTKYVTKSLTHVPAKDAVYYQTVDEYITGKDASLTKDDFDKLTKEDKIKDPAVEEHYEVNTNSILGTTPKVEAYDEYFNATPNRQTLLTSPDDTYYTINDSERDNTYSPFMPSKLSLFTVTDCTSGTTLFAGLNGAYAAVVGEANVHSETQNDNTILVPYVDATSKTGWRAEVINTKISGADMFPASVIVDGKYDVTKVSGYIYNCWKGSERIMPHTPTLPKYK